MIVAHWILCLVVSSEVAPVPTPSTGGFRLQAPLVDHDPESGLWARGSNWKLNVRPDGAAFYPLRAGMDRHRPLSFAAPTVTIDAEPLAAPTAIERVEDGSLVVDRGTFREHWALATDRVEQSFEFAALPRAGELLIELPIATEWEYRGRDGGLLFTDPEFGALRYGDVVTRDAAGRSIATASEYAGDRIRLRVPAGFVAAATFPIVVDPVLEYLVIESGANFHVADASSTYDPVTDRFLVVFATSVEVYQGDSDVFGFYLDGDGNVIGQLALELTTHAGFEPSAAFLAHTRHFPVAYHSISPLGVNSIRIRFLETANVAAGPPMTVKSGDYCGAPRVAGSTRLGVVKAFVVFSEGNFLNPHAKLTGVAISNLGVMSGFVTIDSGGVFHRYDVTVSDGPHGRWTAVWTDNASGSSWSLRGRMIDSSTLATIGGETTIGSSSNPIRNPVVAGDGQTFLCLWERELGGLSQNDVFARKLKFSSGELATDGSTIGFTALDAQSGDAIRGEPKLARDGGRYVFTGNTIGSARTMGTCLPTASGLLLLEQDLPASSHGSNVYPGDVSTVFESGGAVGRALVTWCPREGADVGLEAALYQSAVGAGGVTVAQTGCGGFGVEPKLGFTGQLSLAGGSATVTLSTQPIASPQILIGPPFSWQYCSGCPFGVAPTTIVNAATTTIVHGSSPALVGTQIAIQGLANQPLVGTSCTTPSGVRFQTSDTLIVTLQ